MPHLDDGIIHELLDGEIPSSELAPIQAHLASCEACRDMLNAARDLVSDTDGLIALLDVPQQEATLTPRRAKQPRGSRWLRDVAWAATVAIAVGLGYAGRGAPPLRVMHDTVTVVEPAQASPVEPPRATPKPVRDTAPPARAKVTSKAADVAEHRADEALPNSAANAVNPATAPSPQAGTFATTQQSRLAVAAPPAIGGGGRGGRGADRTGRTAVRIEPIDTISFTEAIGRLGGTIRLIEGMVPARVESQGNRIRVVYPAVPGILVLEQQLVDGKVVFDLVAPPGFSPDSLSVLRSKVRP